MTSSAESRLQTLKAEERVIKSMIQEVKNKYLQLQVEHMALIASQTDILTKCKRQGEDVTNTGMSSTDPEPVGIRKNTQLSHLEEDVRLHDVNVIDEMRHFPFIHRPEHFAELPVTGECTSSSGTERILCENDLDNPDVVNRISLTETPVPIGLSEEEDSPDEFDI